MLNRLELQNLAISRIKEAQVLLDNSYPESAFYLSGYAIELALKATICKNLGIDELFADAATVNKSKEINTAFGKLKIHDLDTLMVFAGLYPKLQDRTEQLFEMWSFIVQMGWNEESRYLYHGSKWKQNITIEKQSVQVFLDTINDFLKWIQQYW